VQLKESEPDLDLSNVARMFGFRNQRIVKVLQESYVDSFPGISEERCMLVQLALADAKMMASIRNKAWKRTIQQARNKVKEQLEEQKVATDANALVTHLSELFHKV